VEGGSVRVGKRVHLLGAFQGYELDAGLDDDQLELGVWNQLPQYIPGYYPDTDRPTYDPLSDPLNDPFPEELR
jgi:hypothetical protein